MHLSIIHSFNTLSVIHDIQDRPTERAERREPHLALSSHDTGSCSQLVHYRIMSEEQPAKAPYPRMSTLLICTDNLEIAGKNDGQSDSSRLIS